MFNFYNRDRSYDRNRNARITTLADGDTAETFTDRRDEGSLNAKVETAAGRTTLTIEKNGVTFQLSGREARTLMSTLNKHEITRRYGA
jgi:hypothetical protein